MIGFSALKHLELLVAHGLRVHRRRRLHCDETEKLEDMVLHHVAQRARLVVVACAILEPDGFGNGDLHVVDVGGIPQWLVKCVGEAQCHQILHRFLAEIVVDAENLLFAEDLADRVVELRRGSEVAADRLLDDDAGVPRDKLVIADLFGNVAENRRPDGEIEGTGTILALFQELLQIVPALLGLGVDGDVIETRGEFLDFRLVELPGLQVFFQGVAREPAVFVMGKARARCADDPRRFRELTFHLTVIKCRQQLALRKIAGAPEHHIVKRFDGNDLAAHGMSRSR